MTAALAALELRDGTIVDVRPMEPGDADRLLRFHNGLSDRTTRYRYFTVHPELSAEEVTYFTNLDHQAREALVAEVDGSIVGVARFDRLADPEEAEVAFVVTDAFQGRGLGTALFGLIAELARAAGVHRFVAEVLPDNRRMLTLFRHTGLPVSSRFDDGTIHVALDLDGG